MTDNIIDINKIKSFDQFMALTQPVGSIESALSNNLYGFNHEQVKSILPENKDNYGLAFFTRPQLNMSTSNLRNLRQMYSLLTNNESSIQRYIRNTLDPRLYHKNNGNIASPLVDENVGFIPILTNNIKTMSGWPDIVAPYFTSKQGNRMEQWGIVDGTTDIYNSFDMDVTFHNTKNEPIILMMQTWLMYMAAVFEGMLSPYIDYIAADLIDYNTRIYRLVLDESKRYVKKISATGASFPVNVPMGEFFDFNDSVNYNDQTKEINIRFKCFGAIYNDPILIKEFNQVSAIFNPDVKILLDAYDTNKIKGGLPDSYGALEKIPPSLMGQLNHRGYPLIDYNTYELCWYINTNSRSYANIKNILNNKTYDNIKNLTK